MSRRNRKLDTDDAKYVDEEEINQNIRDEKLHIDDDPNNAVIDNAGFDHVDVTRKPTSALNNEGDDDNERMMPSTRKNQSSASSASTTILMMNSSHASRDPLGYYKLMGVSPTADQNTIRRAFLQLSQSYHSDKHSQQDEMAQRYMNERFQQLTEAYEVLSDPRRRAAYDHSGAAGIARLELVPMSAVNPAEVKKYLSLLQAEAQLKRTEKLLSSSSSATVHLSAAHHFTSLRGLGLEAPSEEEQQKQLQQQRANIANATKKKPSLGDFSNNKGDDNNGNKSAPSEGQPQQQQQGLTSSSSSSLSSSDSTSDDDSSSSSSSSTPPDPLTEEEKERQSFEEAMRLRNEREAKEMARLRESLARAPPRWDPSMRMGGTMGAGGKAEGAADSSAQPHQHRYHDHSHERREAEKRVSPSAEASSSTPPQAAVAASEEKSSPTTPAATPTAAPVSEGSQTQEPPQTAAVHNKHHHNHQQEHPAAANAVGGGGGPVTNAQLAEVNINGVPTLVAILPAHVANQVRAQISGAGGAIQQLSGEGGEGGEMQQSAAASGNNNANNNNSSSVNKGMLRPAPNARAQQALREMPLMALLSLDFVHMYNFPIGDRTNISFRAAAKKNLGQNSKGDGANIGLSLEHVFSPLNKIRLNAKATFDLMKLQFSHTRVLSIATTLTNKVTLYSGGSLFPDFSMSLSRRLSQLLTLTNTLTLAAGQHGGSFVSSARYHMSNHAVAEGSLEMGFGSVVTGANYMVKLSKKVRAVFVLRTNLLGGSTEMNYEIWYARSHLAQVGVGASVAIPYSYNLLTGVTQAPQRVRVTQFSLLLARGDHSIRVPIVVVVNDHIAKLLLFGAIPALSVSIARLAFKPFSNLHKAKQYQRGRSLHYKSTEAARRKAQIEMLALHSVVAKKRATEEVVGGGGLVILSASYGILHPEVAVLPPLADIVNELTSPLSATSVPPAAAFVSPTDTSSAEAARCIDGTNTTNGQSSPSSCEFHLTLDVKDALQSLVHNSALVLAEGPKNDLPGFYDVDPATTEKRFIAVTYLFKKRLHRVEINAEDALTLPMEEHVDISGGAGAGAGAGGH